MHPPITLCVLPEAAVESVTESGLSSVLEYTDPEVVVTETPFDRRRISNHTEASAVALTKVKNNAEFEIIGGSAGVQVVIAGDIESLSKLRTLGACHRNSLIG